MPRASCAPNGNLVSTSPLLGRASSTARQLGLRSSPRSAIEQRTRRCVVESDRPACHPAPMAASLARVYSCHVELALEILGGKWKPVILAHLKEGPLRYGELRTRIGSRLSDKMLTQ